MFYQQPQGLNESVIVYMQCMYLERSLLYNIWVMGTEIVLHYTPGPKSNIEDDLHVWCIQSVELGQSRIVVVCDHSSQYIPDYKTSLL